MGVKSCLRLTPSRVREKKSAARGQVDVPLAAARAAATILRGGGAGWFGGLFGGAQGALLLAGADPVVSTYLQVRVCEKPCTYVRA